MNKISRYHPSSFSILIIFILLMIIGVSVLPLLNVQLTPSRSLPWLSVSYSLADASARVIEQEVTSKLEGFVQFGKRDKGSFVEKLGQILTLYLSGQQLQGFGQELRSRASLLICLEYDPARFYPLYLLAKLYDENGQTERAGAMAKEVIEKEVKIESTAIKEIQEETRRIIEKQAHTQDMSNPKGKGRKHNHQVAIASCPAPFLKKESEVR